MVTEEQRLDLKNRLEALSADMKDKAVFATRYGLHDGLYKSYEEAGRIHGMTGEGVRLIVKKIEKVLGYNPKEVAA